MSIKVIIHKDDDGYWAEVPSLPGCYSQGVTRDEVEVNIREAIQLHLESLDNLISDGDEVLELEY